jgi:hypothetical protein
MKRFKTNIIIDGIEIPEIIDFYRKLDGEVKLLEMDLTSILKADYLTCVRNPDNMVVGLAGYTRAFGLVPNNFHVVIESEQGKGYGKQLFEKRRVYARDHYLLEIGTVNDPDNHRASIALENKFGMIKYKEKDNRIYFYKAYKPLGRVICKLLPIIMPVMPYLYSMLTFRIYGDIYRHIRKN